MPTVSIIVPAYKAEPFLHRCVDSILAQTFDDFELILVDDGSPDRSGEICEEYATKDSRIHVIHQENGGPAVARNTGIDWAFANSDSQWLMFVDSDDWIHPEMLERLWKAAQKFGVSISACSYQETMGEPVDVPQEQLEATLWSMDDFYLKRNVNAVVPHCKLYAKNCFEKLRYPAGKFAEDEYLSYQVLFQFSQIALIPAPLYAYYYNPDGLTKGTWSPRKLDVWGAYEEQIAFFQETGRQELAKYQTRVYLWNALGQLNQISQLENALQYAPEVKKIKRKKRELLRAAKTAGYTDILADYRKMKLEEWKVLPFIWKAELEKRWKKQ